MQVNDYFDGGNMLTDMWGGLNIIQSNFLEPKKVKYPVRWRTWKERFFTLPWNPGELFVYEEVDENFAIMFNNQILVNPWTYGRLMDSIS